MPNTIKQLQRAKDIVDRYIERGRVFPRELRDCGRTDPVRQQEYRDACKIKTWKYSLMGKNRYTCSDEVRAYLDENMSGWRDRVYSRKGRSSTTQMSKARDIVQRYRERGCIRPRRFNDPSRQQEFKDAVCLSTWKSALKGHNRVTCSVELREYLDENIPGWRDDHNSKRPATVSSVTGNNVEEAWGTNTLPLPPVSKRSRSPPCTEDLMPIAQGIVERYEERNCVLPSLKAECRKDPSRAQECKDAGKLHSWKIHTSEKLTPEVLEFLNTRMPGWKKPATSRSSGPTTRQSLAKPSDLELQFMKAREIVQRCVFRRGGASASISGLPRHLIGRQDTPDLILEQKDALKLSEWKRSVLAAPRSTYGSKPQDTFSLTGLPFELITFLDRELPDWMTIDATSPFTYPPQLHTSPHVIAQQQNVPGQPSTNCWLVIKGTHVRAKPTPRSKQSSMPPIVDVEGLVLSESPRCDSKSELWGGSGNESSFPLYSGCSNKGRSQGIVNSDEKEEEEDIGVAALMQLSSVGTGSFEKVASHCIRRL